MRILVIGRFPPPFDGQALATKRLAELLEDETEIRRINIEPPRSKVTENAGLRPKRIKHFLALRSKLRQTLGAQSNTTILWASISPRPLGHLRDCLVTWPAIRHGQKVFAIIHRGNFETLFTSPSTSLSARAIVRRIDGFIFLSHILAERCSAWIPDRKRFVIPNTIDSDVALSDDDIQMKQAARAGCPRLSLLFLSNMLESKGYLDVLHALPLLSEHIDFEIDFVGDWERPKDAERFFERARSLGVDSMLTHHGRVSDRRKIRGFYQKADILILPTYTSEAQPLVVLEAMNAGVPVISTRRGSIPELIRHGRDGLLVDEHDPAGIAHAVEMLRDRRVWTSYSKATRDRFSDLFAPEKIRGRWLDLLQQSQQSSVNGPS